MAKLTFSQGSKDRLVYAEDAKPGKLYRRLKQSWNKYGGVENGVILLGVGTASRVVFVRLSNSTLPTISPDEQLEEYPPCSQVTLEQTED